jgi:hypothetical protein
MNERKKGKPHGKTTPLTHALDQKRIHRLMSDWEASFLKDDLGFGFKFVELAATMAASGDGPGLKFAIKSAAKVRDHMQRFMALAIHLGNRDRKQILAKITRLNAMIDNLSKSQRPATK